MSEKHTAGLLHVVGEDEVAEGVPCIEIARGEFGPDFKSIADVRCTVMSATSIYDDEFVLTDEDHANARRLVAAWNACDGFSTEALEGVTPKELLEDLSNLSPAPQPDMGVVDMLDRILQSANTMTRPMLIDWLERERQALTSHQEKQG